MEPEFYERALGTAAANMTQRVADLATLRGLLEKHVHFARELDFRVHTAADTVFGPTPTAVGTDASRDRPTPSLAELIGDLGNALANIESGLSRLG